MGEPVLTALPRTGFRGPVIPFVGLAEGLVFIACGAVASRCSVSARRWSGSTSSSGWRTP
ncbi:MAG: hypothetical protein ACRDRI_05215 [Pseudonocardiaceae bacterium]